MQAAVLCVTLLAALAPPCWTASVERVKRQVDGVGTNGLTCKTGTPIETPLIYDSTQSAETILSALPDLTSKPYLDECNRWLGIQSPNDHASDAFVTNVINFPNNNTIAYRADVCCKDPIPTGRCFSCPGTNNPYECNYHNPLTTCATGQSCRTTYTCQGTNALATITKGCSPGSCSTNCASTTMYQGDTCTECCSSSFCNKEAIQKTCYPRSGGTGATNSPGIVCLNGGQRSGAGCCCLPGYTGNTCQTATSSCSKSCMNGGSCMKDSSNNDVCVCPVGFMGNSCERKVTLKCSDPDLLFNITTSVGSSCSSVLSTTLSLTQEIGRCRYDVKARFNLAKPFEDGKDGQVDKVYGIDYVQCTGSSACSTYTIQTCCPSCHKKPCQNEGYCVQDDDGGYVCKCRFGFTGTNCEHKIRTCFVFGEPHYHTYDGQSITHQGFGEFLLSSVAQSSTQLPYFKVLINNEYRGGVKTVTYPSYLEIVLSGYRIRLGKNKDVTMNGQRLLLPATYSTFKIVPNGPYVRLETTFGLVVEWDGYFVGLIQAPSQYIGLLGGICGDMDGQKDDLVDCNGIKQPDTPAGHAAYGDSCRENPKGDEPDTPSTPTCATDKVQQYSSTSWCGYITDASGPFASCIQDSSIQSKRFFDSCVHDVCIDESNRCDLMASFAKICSGNHRLPDNWRTTVNCPMKCGANSAYVARASPCQPTCEKPEANQACPLGNTEMCVCNTNYILKDGTCVPAAQCGCRFNNTRYNIGATWDFKPIGNGQCSRKECVTCTTCSIPVGQVVDKSGNCPTTTTTTTTTTTQPSTTSTRRIITVTPSSPPTCSGSNFDVATECQKICKGTLNPCRYVADPCDCTKYYQCGIKWLGIQMFYKRNCAPCTCWNQDALTCTRDYRNPSCHAPTIPISSCYDSRRNKYIQAVANDNTKFKLGGIVMSCARGTVFSEQHCTCVHGTNNKGNEALGCLNFDDDVRDFWRSDNYRLHVSYNVSSGTVTHDKTGGKRGGAAKFNGGLLELPFFSNWEGKELSITLWYKRQGPKNTGRMALISNRYTQTSASILMTSESVTALGGGVQTTGPTVGITNAARGLTAKFDDWQHVAIVYDGTSIRFYVDGVRTTTYAARGSITKRTCPLYIGAYFQGDYFHGLMDEVCFYVHALTDDEVKKSYQPATRG